MITTAEALGRTVIAVSGATYRSEAAGFEWSYDARSWSTSDPSIYPAMLGRRKPGVRNAWVGGKVVGQQADTFTWREMKTLYDGAGLVARSQDWAIIDGFRADNVMDCVRVAEPGATFRISNVWGRGIRDDFIENDAIMGGLIEDCLAEGCFMFLSERNGTWNGVDELEVRDCVVGLEPQPYDTDVKGAAPVSGSLVSGLGHGQLWKWSTSTTPLTVTDCVFYVPQLSVNGAASMDFPAGTYSGCTLVWGGGGSYPGSLPASGVTVTTDVGVYTAAVADWKARHGVTDFDTVDMGQMIDPV